MKHLHSNWSRTILVCGKCSKKLDGGFGVGKKMPLAKALRKYLAAGKGRKSRLGIVQTKCLGICPRGAVTVLDGASPGQWLIVRSGANIADVAAELSLTPHTEISEAVV